MVATDEIEHLLRTEAPQVLGALVRRFSHFDIAEDATQEALLAASRRWPAEGVPVDPRSWLIRVGYRRMVDLLRSEQAARRREQQVADQVVPNPAASSPADQDDSLLLLFLCCHPALSPGSQVALTLRAVGGLTTAEIAHAYGVTEASMSTRISRAKQRLRDSGARFSPPTDNDRDDRVAAVRHVLYLIFNEGYTATRGDRLARTDLTAEAIRLTRMLRRLLPGDAEVGGLLALMLLTESRRSTRADADNHLVQLEDQDRSQWDRQLIDEGVALIETVWAQREVGPYQLQAAIAAVHAQSASAEETDWPQIAALYLWLEKLAPTAPIRLSRVVAVAKAFGPQRGLALLDDLNATYHLAEDPLTRHREPAVRAHLLESTGDRAAARASYLSAAGLTANEVERRYLLARADALR
ncbi:putative RNA polymerase, sigma-24 subunit, ECF subfamily [Kribbella flavida DSM 17836]|uniref:Putative RNA polymerase, sigma-24 subunit, ECF subfamily n=1 Tax=Kribbella flavida (strain DSM 17836 / JCM 10339 / NBRC 14399) TaxID=479435 RepID=D2PLN2_KRIFD|nr:sigma-70 family RNA polymerase sigma factor [Kribbella flavida]ADB30661.1 putative RNA polymerase, sigma-24 subunit, ECF subfamily [Kribbella flavida DSM 17836]